MHAATGVPRIFIEQSIFLSSYLSIWPSIWRIMSVDCRRASILFLDLCRLFCEVWPMDGWHRPNRFPTDYSSPWLLTGHLLRWPKQVVSPTASGWLVGSPFWYTATTELQRLNPWPTSLHRNRKVNVYSRAQKSDVNGADLVWGGCQWSSCQG